MGYDLMYAPTLDLSVENLFNVRGKIGELHAICGLDMYLIKHRCSGGHGRRLRHWYHVRLGVRPERRQGLHRIAEGEAAQGGMSRT
jgi:hypothetical protein